MTFSADDQRLLTASSEAARLWDVGNLRMLQTMKADDSSGAGVNSFGSGVVTRTAFDPPSTMCCADLSRDGHRALGGVGRAVHIWDTTKSRELLVLRGHQGMISSVTFSPDGWRSATAADDGIVRLWIRRRPEWWWGIAWLPEFWVALFSAGGLVWLGCRRVRGTRTAIVSQTPRNSV
jgi:WD40 repeat protein